MARSSSGLGHLPFTEKITSSNLVRVTKTLNMGITVVMSSHLGEYPGSRSNPVVKFVRAVNSFLKNTLQEKELIIVSDGCDITNKTYDKYYKQYDNIRLVQVEKSKFNWPGELRECGRSLAKYDWIAYLDSDDALYPTYLIQLSDYIKSNPDLKFFTTNLMMIPIVDPEHIVSNPEYLKLLPMNTLEEYLEFKDSNSGVRFNFLDRNWILTKSPSMTGTWCIVHDKYVVSRWKNKNEMGEDSDFIKSLAKEYGKHEANIFGYVICHITDAKDRSKLLWDL
jgi:glycosyltransferase involved in cell wall biosynthesis